MGSEHSAHSRTTFRGRGRAASTTRGGDGGNKRGRSTSPRPSISSDSDIPYISYAVNRPIGDSPQLAVRSPAHGLRSNGSPKISPRPRPRSYAGSSSHDIVVVKEGVPAAESLEVDPEILKLQSIPTFLPIMRGALNIPTVRDPEVLDKLDYHGVLELCSRYQEHLRQCAEVVSTEQNSLATRIREIDYAVTTLMSMLTERQKKFAKYAEQLAKVQEISFTLKQCQMALADTIDRMDSLNQMLLPEDRLEPFVMMTG